MKKIILFFICIFGANAAYCQLQNPSFEIWDSITNEPIYWATSNFYDPGSATVSTDAHAGNFALNLNVVLDSMGNPVQPYAINIFPLTTMPEVLTFWVKGNLQNSNNLSASFTLAEVDSATNVLAYGDQTFNAINSVYQYKFVNILELFGPSLLGQGNIYFSINAPVGSTLNDNTSVWIDELYLGVDNTSLKDNISSNQVIENIYPNPSEDMAYLIFNLKNVGQVSLIIYDVLGNFVQEVIKQNMYEGRYKAEINTSNLNQGIYFCKLQIDGVEYSKKLIKN
jgi:hypothetical protein